ncbi:unnamed protein product [Mytilus edulis]|uniref:MADS-box domain-containing protein n=1 Tax=Mytilus edulis TaxID=6550 RepID=A0A8S3Q8E7_MYTED|nr:unnamed protein product [Mytilus edulis]
MDETEYYSNLQSEVKKMKASSSQRTNKKEVEYLENSSLRRATYCRRGNSLILAAKEIELQTHCRVGVIMQPTWSNGKVHCYKSNLDIEPSTNVNKENEPTEPTEQPQPSTSRLETHRDSPIKRHPVVRVEPLVAKKKNLKQECRMCGVSEETSFFGVVVTQTKKPEDRTASIGSTNILLDFIIRKKVNCKVCHIIVKNMGQPKKKKIRITRY